MGQCFIVDGKYGEAVALRRDGLGVAYHNLGMALNLKGDCQRELISSTSSQRTERNDRQRASLYAGQHGRTKASGKS
jgi:hypothetical protein